MNAQRLLELIDAWRDSALTEDQATELNQLLRDSDEARRTFAAEADMHGQLHCAIAEEAVENVVHRSTPQVSQSQSKRTAWSRMAIALSAFAAGLVVVAIPLWPGDAVKAQTALDPSIRVAEVRHINYIAAANDIDGADNAGFVVKSTAGNSSTKVIAVGSRLGPGIYQLKHGFVELDFFGGAVLALQAPAEIELRSQREARLLAGRVTVEASESGEPFLLHTPAGDVVDIGTRYGVFVDPDGGMEAHVFEGLVDIRPVSAAGAVQRIAADSAMRFSPAGASELLSPDETTFPQPSQDVDDILIQPGFEPGTDLQRGDRAEPGLWQGDVCRIVGQQQTVKPYSGTGMLLFQSTGHNTEGGKTTQASQLSQWIDLSPWRNVIAAGRVQAKITARFNRVSGDAETDSQFSVELESFEAAPDEAQHLRNSRRLARSRTSHQLLSDSNPESWEKIEAVLTLPANSRCIQVTILAFENVVNDDNANAEFDGHFADDLHFQLQIDPVSGQLE